LGGVDGEGLLGTEFDAGGLIVVGTEVTHDNGLGTVIQGDGSEGTSLNAPTAAGTACLVQMDDVAILVEA